MAAVEEAAVAVVDEGAQVRCARCARSVWCWRGVSVPVLTPLRLRRARWASSWPTAGSVQHPQGPCGSHHGLWRVR